MKHGGVVFAEVSLQTSGVSLTSESSSVGWIHGHHGLRDARCSAHTCFVQGSHPEDVRTALHQPGDGEAGVLDRGVVTLSPVMGAHLTPAKRKHVYTVIDTLP